MWCACGVLLNQPVYKQRLFATVYGAATAGHKHPTTMSAAALAAVCVMGPHVSKPVLKDSLDQIVTIVILSLSSVEDALRNAAVGAMQVGAETGHTSDKWLWQMVCVFDNVTVRGQVCVRHSVSLVTCGFAP